MAGRAIFSGAVKAAALSALTGCASIAPTQEPGIAYVRLDGERKPASLAAHAGLFVPYAIMSARAYERLDSRGRLDGQPTRFVTDAGEDVSGLARQWLVPWRFVGGEKGPLCRDGKRGPSCDGVGGLQYVIWARRDCSEVAIAFRGTDRGSVGDWLSNFHGVLRALPFNDQYEQVQAAIGDIVRRARSACPRARLVATGHSLGGGLAQQAAYISPDIRHVYAFDPSFVTGYHDRHTQANLKQDGLTIDRVYEHGEVLAYPRFLIRQFVPETACNPTIRGFRVNLIHGFAVTQHSSEELASGLIRVARKPNDPANAAALPKPDPVRYSECARPPPAPARIAAR